MKKRVEVILFVLFFGGIIIGIQLHRIPDILIGANEQIKQYKEIVNLGTLTFSAASFISVLVLLFQIKSDHEKSRREKAIEMLFEWADKKSEEMEYAKKIVEKFSSEQCRKLYLEEEFIVDKLLYYDIKKMLNRNKIKDEDNMEKFSLSKLEVKKIKYFITKYLNLLESILVAWQYSVADREIIENEFSSLYSLKEGQSLLQNYRVACGNADKFPAIELFCIRLEERAKGKLKEKGNVA